MITLFFTVLIATIFRALAGQQAEKTDAAIFVQYAALIVILAGLSWIPVAM